MANSRGAKKEAKLKTCVIVQQLNEAYFKDWYDEELKTVGKAISGDSKPIADVIGNKLKNAGIEVSESYFIVHDKDVRKKWSDVHSCYVVEKKETHFHMLIRFKEGCECFLGQISNAVGIDQQYIEKLQKGRFSFDNSLAYLIHIKDDSKYPYPAEAVYSACYEEESRKCKPYTEIYAERYEDWMKGKAKFKRQKADIDIDALEEMILTGQVSKSQVILTDEYYAIYSRNCRRCEDAFHVYGERRAYKTINALENGEFKLSVFYITGVAGSGKTRLAKIFVNSLIRASADYSEEWRVCQTAASNPMDDYMGEEILLMDDVRGSAMSASDWLKLLDPYNISPSSARYKNKTPACRVIVITSTKEPIEFFYYCKQMGGGDRSEALDQFMRRIQCLTKVIKADDFKDATAMISEGRRGNTYQALIGDTEEKVSLTYRFEDGKEIPINEAVDLLVKVALKNNKMFDGEVELPYIEKQEELTEELTEEEQAAMPF